MRAPWNADRLAAELRRLGDRALPLEEYHRAAAERLRRAVDFDAACWHTLDPQTRLMTSDAPQELIEAGVFSADGAVAAGRQLVASEYLIDDVNTFAGLAARRHPAAILSEVTRGRPERSTRYRELLEPAGIPFELRAAFVSRGRAWGAVHLARGEGGRDFDGGEAAALAAVASIVADGIRASLRFDAARRPQEATAPGLMVLGPGDEVELITPPARELIAALRSAATSGTGSAPPTPVLALAAFLRDGPAETTAPAVVAVPSSIGWVTLHASLPEGRADGRVAIVLERAPSERSTALRLESHGVTDREREVATLLARGLTNSEIAAALVLSPYTVQDHIRSLFEKTGVGSRQELVARVFLDDYLPRIADRSPLTAGGAFAP